MPDRAIRNYTPEDLAAVVELYRSCPAKSPSFPRDGDYFTYFLAHPGVREDSVFVATAGGSIEGVAVLAVIHQGYTRGRVIELWAGEVGVASALLQRIEDYCHNHKIDVIEVKVPPFLDMGKTFTNWHGINPNEVLMVKPLSLAPLLHAVFSAPELRKISDGKDFYFISGDETVEVKVSQGEARVRVTNKFQPGPGSVVVKASSSTLVKLIFTKANPYLALLTGQIRIGRIRDTSLVLKILRTIKINQPWMVAIADAR